MGKELAVKEEKQEMKTFEASAALEDFAEDMDGLEFRPERIKVPGAGGLSFAVTDELGNDDAQKTITGVIVYKHPMNSYYVNEYTGGNEPPDCWSTDGKVSESGKLCAKCEYNQFESKGLGKACANKQVLYILGEGEILPRILYLPPTSLGNLRQYVQRLISRGNALKNIVTEISLEKAQSKDGIAYSRVKFTASRKLNGNETETIESVRQFCVGYSKRAPVEELSDSGGFSEASAEDLEYAQEVFGETSD
ncbi:MAG: hypothetical protein LBL34_01395 [Clostridiales bacterium]|jgi:hypothetical protein|nr:hypothetical protein [Clostridiales bacterium]